MGNSKRAGQSQGPKGSKNLSKLVENTFNEPVVVNENGRRNPAGLGECKRVGKETTGRLRAGALFLTAMTTGRSQAPHSTALPCSNCWRRLRIDVQVVYKVDRLTRALADFAKLVELFERHSVSFVSITQSFNTTSSMGRLTLNVLLSFAQF